MSFDKALRLNYTLSYGGQPAGEQWIGIETKPYGARYVLSANVEHASMQAVQRWESKVNAAGYPFNYLEHIDTTTSKRMEVEFSLDNALITVSQGREDYALPYLTDTHDPLSLLIAITQLDIEVEAVAKFAMVGGRAYVERLADTADGLQTYRLRPGLSMVYLNAQKRPVRLTQNINNQWFEAELTEVSWVDPAELNKRHLPSKETKSVADKRRRRY